MDLRLRGKTAPITGGTGGQAPINIITAQSLPNPQAQQLFQPVGQGVVTYQPNEVLTFQGYYQFEWEPYISPGFIGDPGVPR